MGFQKRISGNVRSSRHINRTPKHEINCAMLVHGLLCVAQSSTSGHHITLVSEGRQKLVNAKLELLRSCRASYNLSSPAIKRSRIFLYDRAADSQLLFCRV